MVTDIPNAYFVEVGIYKWTDSPTYTLGRWNTFTHIVIVLTFTFIVVVIVIVIVILWFN